MPAIRPPSTGENSVRRTMQWLAGGSRPSFSRCLVAIIVIGVVLRLLLIALPTTSSNPENSLYSGYTDGAEYADIANSLVEHGTFGYAGGVSASRHPDYRRLV